MKEKYAPCGIDCSYCPVYIATQNNDVGARQKLADEYFSQSGETVDPQVVSCNGCLGEGTPLHYCSICEIRACARDRGLQTCAECADFPCPKGQHIWQTNSHSLANLQQLRNEAQKTKGEAQ